MEKVNKGKGNLFNANNVIPERNVQKKLRQFEIENQMLKDRSSSEQERKVNALASGADEGRDKLR